MTTAHHAHDDPDDQRLGDTRADRGPGAGDDHVDDAAAAGEEPVSRGMEHLQTAALEMISAARAFLDVVEELVTDPDKVADVANAVSSVAATVTDAARRVDGRIRPQGGPQAHDSAEPSDEGVQRIRVS